MRFMKPYRRLVAVTLLVLLIDNVGTLLVPTMLANMVNTGITTGDVDYILRNGLYMLIATGMASGGAVLGCYLSARLAANVACDIRNAVYDKSLELSASDFERFGTGSMITRSLNDINVIQQAILQTIQLVLPVPFLAVAGIIFAWLIDPAMGMLLGVVVAIVLVAAVFTVANAAPIFMRLQSFIDRMNVVLRENIVGVRVIRAFNKERREEQRLDEVFSDYAANAIKVNHLFVGLDSSTFFLMNIAEVAVLWVGGNRVGAHAMQIASISAVLEYALLILFFVMMAQMVVLTLPRAAACLNRAQQVLEIKPSIVDGQRTLDAAASDSKDGADAVAVFDHMSFRFDDADEDTLCDLSFACRRGQTTAIVGSTGSGKSTTLYATLGDVARPEINIITVEDPVEFRMEGINQVQVNNKAGMTFAAALRSILRADPDVVLIGEIRDEETATIAIEASLTGHLVLSTLHTNDAPSAVTRLTEMGVEPFLVSSSLAAVMAQRLARRLCKKCRKADTATPVELKMMGVPYTPGSPLPTVYRAMGCRECSNTGYHGRVAIQQVMGVDTQMEDLIARGATSLEIEQAAKSKGMTSLREDGWQKVLQGITSVDEVLRVTV